MSSSDLKSYEIDENSYTFCTYLVNKSISRENQVKYRAEIKREIMSIIQLERISIDNIHLIFDKKILTLLLDLYDRFFFDNLLKTKMKIYGCSLSICVNNRCTTTAGKCSWGGRQGQKCFTIELSSKTFLSAFQKTTKRTSGGVNCDDLLDCLMLTFEHELIHALVMCFCPDWAYDKKYIRGSNKYNSIPYSKPPSNWTGRTSASTGHSGTFMSILYNLFGQIEYKHGLFGSKSIKEKSQLINKIKIGDIITFWGKFRLGYRKKSQRQKLTATIDKIKRKNVDAIMKDETGRDVIWTIPVGAILTINDNPTENVVRSITQDITSPEILPEANSGNTLTGIPTKIPESDEYKVEGKGINTSGSKKRKKLKIISKLNKPLTSPKVPTPKVPTPKIKLNNNRQNSKFKSKKYASIINKKGKTHKSKYVKEGECIFPFKFKRKIYTDCLDTGNGPWCPTIELKPNKNVNTWGYCIE